eukprot:SAG22_NODE_829_length_6953_cov_1.693026_3_plen_325_part_00
MIHKYPHWPESEYQTFHRPNLLVFTAEIACMAAMHAAQLLELAWNLANSVCTAAIGDCLSEAVACAPRMGNACGGASSRGPGGAAGGGDPGGAAGAQSLPIGLRELIARIEARTVSFAAEGSQPAEGSEATSVGLDELRHRSELRTQNMGATISYNSAGTVFNVGMVVVNKFDTDGPAKVGTITKLVPSSATSIHPVPTAFVKWAGATDNVPPVEIVTVCTYSCTLLYFLARGTWRGIARGPYFYSIPAPTHASRSSCLLPARSLGAAAGAAGAAQPRHHGRETSHTTAAHEPLHHRSNCGLELGIVLPVGRRQVSAGAARSRR